VKYRNEYCTNQFNRISSELKLSFEKMFYNFLGNAVPRFASRSSRTPARRPAPYAAAATATARPARNTLFTREVVLLASASEEQPLPRGAGKQRLIRRGLVLSALHLNKSWTPEEVMANLFNSFRTHLDGMPEPRSVDRCYTPC
jgi:hypothetical protein